MDRNLGALCVEIDNYTTAGGYFFYQSGRKDPLPNCTEYNILGVKIRNKMASAAVSQDTDMCLAVKNPHIQYWSNSLYWINSYGLYSDRYSLNWNNPFWNNETSQKSLFDPCPTGWKMPDSKVFNGIAKKASSRWSSRGYQISLNGVWGADGCETGWFPASGYLATTQGAYVLNSGSDGVIATNTMANSGWAFYFHFANNLLEMKSGGGLVHLNSASAGFNVRCIQE